MSERDYDDAFAYLEDLLQGEVRDTDMVRVAMAACRQNLRDYPYVARSRPQVNARPHHYGPNWTEILHGDQRRAVFAAMQRNGAFSAPAFSHRPIQTGTVSILWPLMDMVVRLVDPVRLLVYNVTLPKHVLFPGYVKLEVAVRGGSTQVGVSGRGAGNWAHLNENGGPYLFEAIVDSLASHLRVRQFVRSLW